MNSVMVYALALWFRFEQLTTMDGVMAKTLVICHAYAKVNGVKVSS